MFVLPLVIIITVVCISCISLVFDVGAVLLFYVCCLSVFYGADRLNMLARSWHAPATVCTHIGACLCASVSVSPCLCSRTLECRAYCTS